MTSWRNALRHWSFVPLAFAAVLGLWLAADGRLHWDQPSSLYAAAYQNFAQIVAGDVQPSRIPEFFQGRILHVLLLKCLLAVTGPGMVGFGFLVGIHFVLILGFLLIVNRILQGLLPTLESKSSAVVLLAMTPVMLYLAFKPMADVESLAAAALVSLALLRCGQGKRTMAWSAAAAIGLAVVALTKNQMAFMPVGFWASACLIPIGGIERRRLAWTGVVAGLAGLALTIVVLEVLDVGVARYLGSYTDVLNRDDPFAAQLLNFATLLGPLWLLVPMAAFSHRRRELGFLLLWTILSLTPLLVVASQFEARHLAVILIAVAGLFGLALEHIPTRFHAWGMSSHGRKIVISTLAVLVLMAGNAVTLAVMPHEFEIRQMRTLLNDLDRRFGHGRYVVLTPWPYTDFHAIRFLWPDIDVRNVDTSATWVRAEDASSRRQLLAAWYDGRFIESAAELAEIDRPMIYIGFVDTFSVENLREILNSIFGAQFAARMLGKIELVNHLATSWLWTYPDANFEEITRSGHYLAYEVTIP